MCDFQIEVTELGWINGPEDDPQDLCCHGKVTAQIGSETIQDDGTVSATALYLLRSLTEDHQWKEGLDNQMIPCCGHFLIANEDLTQVTVLGCPNGTDWKVEHVPNGVNLITESGNVTFVPIEEYREEVYRFADKVEAFYRQCTPKLLPSDIFARNGYAAFWNEWHHRRYGQM